MATRTIILAALLAAACEPEPAPAESPCARWLACYEQCNPLEYAGAGEADFARASVQFCAAECDDAGEPSSTPTAIAVLDEQLVDRRATDAERIEAGIAAIQHRATCRLEGGNSAE